MDNLRWMKNYIFSPKTLKQLFFLPSFKEAPCPIYLPLLPREVEDLHIDAIADQPAPPSTSIANMLLNSCGKIPEEKYLKKPIK